MPALTTTTPGVVAQLELRQRVWSPNLLAELLVCGRNFGKDVPAEVVARREAQPIAASLSQDGRSWLSAWHEGPVSAEPAVYVERISADGLEFHGWVDPDSRRLVQVG